MAAPNVVVIGGGFAGLAAAVDLARRGIPVTVLEGKPALGGRAYSFEDPASGDTIDNGQHVLMGCYAATLDFLGVIGAAGGLVFQRDLEIEMLAPGGRAAVLRTAHLPGPLHMSAALLRYGHLSLGERLSVVRGGLRLLAMRRNERATLEHMTVAVLMDVLHQSEQARRAFWYPLAIATLNDLPELSSAALLAEVLKRAFFARRSDSAFVYPRRGLSALYCAPAREFIERRGGKVMTRAIVERLEPGDGPTVANLKLRDGAQLEASQVISAVGPEALLRMLPEPAVAEPFFARLRALESSPIVCAHVWFDREITRSAFTGFIGATTQWLFNKRRIFERRGERHPGYLSFVISGARELVDRASDELLDLILADLRSLMPAAADARVTRSLVLKEKHATMAPAPHTHGLRPGAETPLRNFHLAGDWVETGLPATIESAVLSGRAAAARVLAQIEAR